MANNVVNKTVNIYIESGQAQKALDALVKKETQLKQELEKATNPKVVDRLNKEIAALAEPIDRAAKKLSGELSPAFRDVQATVNNLGNRLKRLSAEDADFEPVLAQWRQGKAELDAQTQKIGVLQRAMNSFWKEAKTVAVGVIVGNTVESMLETVMGYVTGMVTGSAKIADELSSIEKTTGLTKDQVRQLNSELSKIDTRTSTSGLREIAAGLGQIGQAATATNVAAIDKIVVALGDEFGGGAQQITTTLGVLRNNLQDIKTGNYGEDVLHIGNALNVLGAEGLATAPVVTDIANRIAGVGGTFGLTSGQILGTAATFQELGIEAERGSTAFVKIMQKMAAEPEKFASIAGKSVKDFTQLVNTDMEAAFVAVAKGAKEAGSSNAVFGKILKDLDADGSGAGEVLSKLATNSELLEGKIKLASGALKESSSITSEFNNINNNAAGELEKLKKNFASLFSSSTITEASAGMVRFLNSFVNLLKSIPAFVSENRTAIVALISVYAAYAITQARAVQASILMRAASLLEAAQHKATALVQGIVTAATAAASAAKAIFTTRTGAATAAMRIYNAVIRANPLGLLVTVLGAAATALSYFTSKTGEDTTAQQNHNDVLKDVRLQTSATKDEIKALTGVLTSSTASTDEKSKALERLKNISHEYLDGLTLENITTKEGIAIIDNYIKHIDALADAKARVNLKSKLKEQLLESDNKLSGFEVEKAGAGTSITGDGDLFGINIFGRTKDIVDKDIKEEKEARASVQRRYDALSTENDKQVELVRHRLAKNQKDMQGFLRYTSEGKKVAQQIATDQQYLATITGVGALAAPEQSSTTKTYVSPSDTKAQEKADKKAAREEAKAERQQKKAEDQARKLADSLRKLSLEFLPDDSLAQKFEKQFQELEEKFAVEREKIENAEGVSKEKKNALLLQLDAIHLKATQQLYVQQGEERLKLLEKQTEDEKRIAAERKANLQKLMPVAVKLEGSAVQLHETLGRGEAAKAELAAAKRSAKEKHDFLIEQLNEERAMVLANTQLLGVEKENLVRQIDEKIAAEQKNHLVGQLQSALDYAKQAIDLVNLFGNAKTEKENAELARDKAANDKKKKNLDDRLKKGLISQAEHDRQVAAIDKKAEAREKEIKAKQFKRNQKAQITQALMNGALAVTNILATMPKFDFGVASAIAIAAAIATTAAQVASIAGQKVPEYGTGGLLSGPSHRNKSKGMPVSNPYTGEVQAYLEGGEMIGSKRTADDTRQYNVSGTPSQIFSLLNGINGGVTWESGATLRPAWSTVRPVPMNFSAVNDSIGTVRRFYAAGGKFGETADAPAAGAGTNGQEMMAVLQRLISTTDSLASVLSSLQAYGITANVSLSKLEDAQKRRQAIEDAATMR